MQSHRLLSIYLTILTACFDLKLGLEQLEVSWSGIFPTPSGPVIAFSFTYGYGHEFEIELFQKDCNTPIVHSPFSSSSRYGYSYRRNLTAIETTVVFESKSELFENNGIYDEKTGKVRVCAIGRLNSQMRYNQTFEIQHGTPGIYTFMSSWTSGNTITVNYVVKKDYLARIQSELLQVDCSSLIDDTDVVKALSVSSWDNNHNYTSFMYTLDPETARNSDIFNDETSSIEVCHTVRKDNSNKRDKQVFTIPVREPGTFAGLFGDPHIMTLTVYSTTVKVSQYIEFSWFLQSLLLYEDIYRSSSFKLLASLQL